jgi:hypothetical protein
MRCVVCYRSFEGKAAPADTVRFVGCPYCHSRLRPLNEDNDAQIQMNWDELKMLFFWAHQWIKHVSPEGPEAEALKAMAARMKNLKPPDGEPLSPLVVKNSVSVLISRKGEIVPIQDLHNNGT